MKRPSYRHAVELIALNDGPEAGGGRGAVPKEDRRIGVMKKKSRVSKMRILASVPIGLCMQRIGRWPTATELALYTAANPDLFPEPWTEAQAQFCLDNPNHVLDAES